MLDWPCCFTIASSFRTSDENLSTRSLCCFLSFLIPLHATTNPLKTGENLPVIQGETLEGKSYELPATSSEKITFIVFSFSKKGGSVARKWVERFDKEFGSNPNGKSYSVMFLEGVPRLLRGMVSSGIKKGFPKSKHSQALLIYKDEKLWKERLGVLKEDDPYLALLDSSGKILWLHTGQFSENHFSELNDEIQRKLE